jgi:hypothetical protein
MKKYAVALTLPGVAILAAYAPDYSQFDKPLTKDQEILHALNRIAFGPRPGDVEAVQKMGLKKWIDQQLHPERIAENPELAERLKPLESLRMSAAEIATNYPPPVVVQAMLNGLLPMPADPEARARMELQSIGDRSTARVICPVLYTIPAVSPRVRVFEAGSVATSATWKPWCGWKRR